jgi:hemoglobin
MPKAFRFALIVSAAVALGACATAKPKPVAQTAAVEPPKSLYDRLGGKPAIEAVIGEFLGNVAGDDRINSAFGLVDLVKLRTHLIDFVCVATGGPCQYTGRDMKSAHAGMGITGAQFDALVEDLVKALDKFNVPAEEKGELLGALGPLKPQIVEVP